ncbi:MAG: phosphatidylinositol-specific phospholipase C [Niabella sp.]|nr:phosphatidylinositol-specific phospholipase C [Niabella sp.]
MKKETLLLGYGNSTKRFFAQCIDVNGTLINEEIENLTWVNDYSNLISFNTGGHQFIAAQNSDKSFFIQQVFKDGSLGPETTRTKWNRYYATLTGLQAGNRTFIAGQSSDDHRFFIQEILENGTPGQETTPPQSWHRFYPKLITLQMGPACFIAGQSPTNNHFFIQKIHDNGTLGAETTSQDWHRYYETLTFIPAGNRHYIAGQSANGNYFFIQEVFENGTLGPETTPPQSWHRFYHTLIAVQTATKSFIAAQCKDDHSFFIQEVLDNGTLGAETCRQTWNRFYNNLVAIKDFAMYIPAAKWMAAVDDAKILTELTIPGTHDSCAYDVSSINYGYLLYLLEILPAAEPVTLFLKALIALGTPIAIHVARSLAQCQTLDIPAQLNKGIRFLDIRLKKEENTLQAYHGIIKLPLTFPEIMRACYDFLNHNPEETIIISINNEGSGSNPIDGLVASEIARHTEKWYTGTAVPQLRQVRGKAVLLRRYAAASAANQIGIEAHRVWPNEKNPQVENVKNDHGQHFSIQDDYNGYQLTELDHKFKNHVKPFLELAAAKKYPGNLFINFTSGMGIHGIAILPPPVYPKTLAKGEESYSSFQGTNKLLLDDLNSKGKKAALGIIPMDFPEYPASGMLIRKLFQTNDFSR